jgi:probable rRNA maturation factor
VLHDLRVSGRDGLVGQHAAHLVVHGTLHALGYDHEKVRDAKRMENLETQILATMGIDNPYVIQEK